MMTLRRSSERRLIQRRLEAVWLTFDPHDRIDPLADGFGDLQSFEEVRLRPRRGTGVPLRRHRDAEIVTYVREGALLYRDSMGRSGVVRAGEFQRVTGGAGVRHGESNASRTDRAHAFQMRLRPSDHEREADREQKRFSAAERRGLLCVVASRDGRGGSMQIRQDALIYATMLDPGQHLVHELSPGRSAWLHLVQGEATVGEVILSTGDGAGLADERSVSLTAREDTEILLVDVGDRSLGLPETRVLH
jgi:quercetin 2,3-dioxygenase